MGQTLCGLGMRGLGKECVLDVVQVDVNGRGGQWL